MTLSERITKLKELERAVASTMEPKLGSFKLPNREWATLVTYYCNNTLAIIEELEDEIEQLKSEYHERIEQAEEG